MSSQTLSSNWPFLANSSQFLHWTQNSMAWNIPLARLDPCPGQAPRGFLLHLLTGRARKTEKLQLQSWNHSATAKTSMSCQCYSRSKSKIQHSNKHRERINSLPATARPACISHYKILHPFTGYSSFFSSRPFGSHSRGKFSAKKNTWCFALGKKAMHQSGMEKEGASQQRSSNWEPPAPSALIFL